MTTNPSRPSHHANSTATAFKNPWPSGDSLPWSEVVQLSFPFSWYPKLHTHSHARELQVIKPDWGVASLEAQKIDRTTKDCVIGTWLGHAGALIEFSPPVSSKTKEESVYLLFDPIFSERAGPTPYTGPGRFKKSPCQIADLPGCDAVFISHNHYDHLDLATVTDIVKTFPEITWFVPLGNKKWLVDSGVDAKRVEEMDWWETREGSFMNGVFKSLVTGGSQTTMKVSCVPAQHNSGRSGLDSGATLWCGWVVERFTKSTDDISPPKGTRNGAVYHAGDTGYRRTTKSSVTCPVFKEIGQKFGPFDLSFIPIWRGGTLGFISYWGLRLSHHDIPSGLHCSPGDAIEIHKDVKSRNTVGVHFGTFVGSESESLDAMIEFREACDEAGVTQLDGDEVGKNGSRAGTLDLGGSLAVAIGE